ncbi:MAG TPA: MaoC/PaaZ C-terminal domain-containing protein [bacterium]
MIFRSKNKGIKSKTDEDAESKQAFQIAIQIEDGQQLQYARASGDNNFSPANNFLARIAGLPRTIMNGACVLAMSCSSILREILHNDIRQLLSVRGRFGKPTIPEEKLILIGYKSTLPDEIPFAVFNEAGQAVFKNGILKVNSPKNKEMKPQESSIS